MATIRAMLRYWPIRLLLYIAGVAVGGAASMGAQASLGMPWPVVAGLAFWVAFDMTIAKACLRHVDSSRLLRGLFWPLWPLASVGVLLAQAMPIAQAMRPEAPDIAAALPLVLTPAGLGMAIVAGPVVALLLMVPAIVAVGDDSSALLDRLDDIERAKATEREEAIGAIATAPAPAASAATVSASAAPANSVANAASNAAADRPYDPFWFLFGGNR